MWRHLRLDFGVWYGKMTARTRPIGICWEKQGVPYCFLAFWPKNDFSQAIFDAFILLCIWLLWPHAVTVIGYGYCHHMRILWSHAVTVTGSGYYDLLRLLWPHAVTITYYGYCNLLYIILCVSVTGSGYYDLLWLLWPHAVTITYMVTVIYYGYCNLLCDQLTNFKNCGRCCPQPISASFFKIFSTFQF